MLTGGPRMAIEVEAVYENGILKLDHPLPLAERQRVKVLVRQQPTIAQKTYGIIGWKGDPEVVRRIANDPEFGIEESP
jgi:predicted DNA-binding antitoxin AbrB/MazE fold protein